MPVVRPLPQVVHPEIDQPGLDRLADQRQPQRREVVGEDRDDVDPEPGVHGHRPTVARLSHGPVVGGRLPGNCAVVAGSVGVSLQQLHTFRGGEPAGRRYRWGGCAATALVSVALNAFGSRLRTYASTAE